MKEIDETVEPADLEDFVLAINRSFVNDVQWFGLGYILFRSIPRVEWSEVRAALTWPEPRRRR